MRVEREKFLASLQMVRAGLSSKESTEQSSCFAFSKGRVMTFNDEVACQKDSDVGLVVEGAVQAVQLLALLDKMPDDELMAEVNPQGQLEFRGKGKRFALTMDAKVLMPIDRVELPKAWRPIPKGFVAAIERVLGCVSKDDTKFHMTCVHIHPEHIEACDNYQLMRCPLVTGLKAPVLVRGTSMKHIIELGMSEVGMTSSWVHFRNPSGLIFSCRRYAEEYPNLDDALDLEDKGKKIVIPRGLKDTSERASVFATDNAGDPVVIVSLSEERLSIKGEGLSGWYEERRKVDYSGPPINFLIRPDLLKHISENYSEALLTDRKLKVMGSDEEDNSWQYVTVLGRPKEEGDEDPELDAEETEQPRRGRKKAQDD